MSLLMYTTKYCYQHEMTNNSRGEGQCTRWYRIDQTGRTQSKQHVMNHRKHTKCLCIWNEKNSATFTWSYSKTDVHKQCKAGML